MEGRFSITVPSFFVLHCSMDQNAVAKCGHLHPSLKLSKSLLAPDFLLKGVVCLYDGPTNIWWTCNGITDSL